MRHGFLVVILSTLTMSLVSCKKGLIDNKDMHLKREASPIVQSGAADLSVPIDPRSFEWDGQADKEDASWSF